MSSVDVRRLLQHQPRRLNGVAQPLHAGHAAGLQVCAGHQQGVALDAAVAGQKRSAPGIEGVIVLHHSNGGFDRVSGRSTTRESVPTGGQRRGDPALVRGDGVIGHGPRAAVDEQDGLSIGCGTLG